MNPNTFNKIKRLLAGKSFVTKEPGNSMLPLYKSNEEHLLTPITWDKCSVGDVVFCKVRGNCYTHKRKYSQWPHSADMEYIDSILYNQCARVSDEMLGLPPPTLSSHQDSAY